MPIELILKPFPRSSQMLTDTCLDGLSQHRKFGHCFLAYEVETVVVYLIFFWSVFSRLIEFRAFIVAMMEVSFDFSYLLLLVILCRTSF